MAFKTFFAGSNELRRRAVVVSLCYPEPGTIGSLLAGTLGELDTARLQKIVADQVLRQVLPVGDEFTCFVHYRPRDRRAQIERWLHWAFRRAHFSPCSDAPGAEFVAHDFEFAFGHGADRVVRVSSSCLDLDRETIERVFPARDSCEAIVGPSGDESAYLVGLRRPQNGLFDGLPWNEPGAFPALLERLESIGIDFEVLPDALDVNSILDLSEIPAERWTRFQPALKEQLRMIGFGYLVNS